MAQAAYKNTVSWRFKYDVENIVMSSNAVKIHADLYEVRKIAADILKVLDSKYGLKLAEMEFYE